MMRPIFLTRRKNSKGAALVEFALVLGLLFVLVMGVIEFSLLLKDYLTVGEAAAQGAYVASRGESYSTVQTAIQNAAHGLTWSSVTITITYGPTGSENTWSGGVNPASPGNMIIVKVSYSHQLVTGLFNWLGSGGVFTLVQSHNNLRSNASAASS